LPETRAAYEPDADPARRAAIERLVSAFDALMHRMVSTHAPQFLEVGLTMSQAKLLYLVQAQPNVRSSALASGLAVSLSTVSGVVDRLVDLGMLTRHDDPADRRQVVIRITEEGVAHLERLRELNAGELRALLARVDVADMPVIERALDVLAAAAASAPGAASATSASPATEGEPA